MWGEQRSVVESLPMVLAALNEDGLHLKMEARNQQMLRDLFME
jgi:hypothetical protein